MADKDAIFVLSKENVIGRSQEMGIPEEAITDDVLQQVKNGVEWGLECRSEVVGTALNRLLRLSFTLVRKQTLYRWIIHTSGTASPSSSHAQKSQSILFYFLYRGTL